ncbi:MAG: hypothetical protein N2482_03190, partial [Patescibacteria group bacterium]|nr:hypothetical protein [Patescibacteria group bacterium]
NNWANGWRIGQELVKNGQSQLKLAKNSPKPVSTIFNQFQPIITIIFWPQYLQFLGFGLLILTLIYVLISPISVSSNSSKNC